MLRFTQRGLLSWLLIGMSSALAAEAEVPAPSPALVDLRGYVLASRLPAHLRSRTLPRAASAVILVLRPESFVDTQLTNYGIVFQAGTLNPERFNRRVPFCTMKFVGVIEEGGGRVHNYSDAELIRRIVETPVASSQIRSNHDRISQNYITMIDVNTTATPNDTVNFVHCMVSINSEDLYREPSVAQLIQTFGANAQLYVKARR